LRTARESAQHLGLEITSVHVDGTRSLPFADRQFDCVWGAGLFERATAAERRVLLSELARISARVVVSFTVSGAHVPVEGGLSAKGPGFSSSLQRDFEAAGLRVVSECLMDVRQGWSSLQANHARAALPSWLDPIPPATFPSWNEDAVLMTIGVRDPKLPIGDRGSVGPSMGKSQILE
jgi:hypothetical protein